MSSEELFAIRNQFYSSQYSEVISNHDIDNVTTNEIKQYILRSYLALGQYSKVIELANNEPELAGLVYYSKYLSGDQSIADEFVSYAKSNKPSLLTQILAAIVLVKQYQRYDDAIELLTSGINMENHDELNLEVFSVIVQIYLLQDALSKAKNFLKKFSHLNINDSVVYNYSDALVSLVQGGSTATQHAFYFFEEISHSLRSLKNLTFMMVVHLLLNHVPESSEIMEQIDELIANDDSLKADEHYLTYLINKAKVLIINNQGSEALQLINNEILSTADQSHPYVVDYNEKIALFDGVVDKYAAQISN